MKVPFKSLKLGAQRFTIEECDESMREDAKMLGDTDSRLGRIRIVKGQPTAQMGDTLIHEICHAVLFEAGMVWYGPEIEVVIERLSPRIAAMFKDNPKQMHALIDLFQNEDA